MLRSYRVYVTDGIGGRNAAEVMRVIDNGHEKIGGADEALAVSEVVHGCVILRAPPHQQPGVSMLRTSAGKYTLQYLRRDLAATAPTMTVLCQSDVRVGHD